MRTIKEALIAIAFEGHRRGKENKRATNAQDLLDYLHVDCSKEIREHLNTFFRRTRGFRIAELGNNPRCKSL